MYSAVLIVTWLVPRETASVSAHVLCTPNNAKDSARTFRHLQPVTADYSFLVPVRLGAVNIRHRHLHAHNFSLCRLLPFFLFLFFFFFSFLFFFLSFFFTVESPLRVPQNIKRSCGLEDLSQGRGGGRKGGGVLAGMGGGGGWGRLSKTYRPCTFVCGLLKKVCNRFDSAAGLYT